MFSENSFIIFNFVDQFWSKLRSLQKFGGIKFHHPPPSQIELRAPGTTWSTKKTQGAPRKPFSLK